MISSHQSNGPGQGRFEQDGCFNFLSLPPRAEQHRIVAKLAAQMALCDLLGFALAQTDTTRASLHDSLLHEALAPTAAEMEGAA